MVNLETCDKPHSRWWGNLEVCVVLGNLEVCVVLGNLEVCVVNLDIGGGLPLDIEVCWSTSRNRGG